MEIDVIITEKGGRRRRLHFDLDEGEAVAVGRVRGNDIVLPKGNISKRQVRLVNTEGVSEADGDHWHIRDGIVCIPRNAVIPDGTVIGAP